MRRCLTLIAVALLSLASLVVGSQSPAQAATCANWVVGSTAGVPWGRGCAALPSLPRDGVWKTPMTADDYGPADGQCVFVKLGLANGQWVTVLASRSCGEAVGAVGYTSSRPVVANLYTSNGAKWVRLATNY